MIRNQVALSSSALVLERKKSMVLDFPRLDLLYRGFLFRCSFEFPGQVFFDLVTSCRTDVSNPTVNLRGSARSSVTNNVIGYHGKRHAPWYMVIRTCLVTNNICPVKIGRLYSLVTFEVHVCLLLTRPHGSWVYRHHKVFSPLQLLPRDF